MRIVVTGGGTGGHVYPALEVALEARRQGDEILYLGSLRGQEGGVAAANDILFHGFPSLPLVGLKSLAGAKAAFSLVKSTALARARLAVVKPDIVFSTGGYSAAPVMLAAKSLGVPLALHACDAVPGRALRMVADAALTMTCTIESTGENVSAAVRAKLLRTGHPVRAELRSRLEKARTGQRSGAIFAFGGSQGSAFLNDLVPKLAVAMPEAHFLLSAGKGQFEKVTKLALPDNLEVVPYLEAEAMAKALGEAPVVIARSGSSIAEIAVSRVPSILVPLPSSADDHQAHNAFEFEKMGVATILKQPPSGVAEEATVIAAKNALETWLNSHADLEATFDRWDNPSATADIYQNMVNALKNWGRR